MTPEQAARIKIDKLLETAGWKVQSLNEFNPSAGLGIAVREYPTSTGPADYILFIDRKPVGVIEAKAEGKTLSGVHEQTTRYSTSKIKFIEVNSPLPFQYESTGVETFFTDARDPNPRQREIFNFHRPETLYEYYKEGISLRKRLTEFPLLQKDGLRECQINAINNLEKSFSENHPRALIQMATGSGKTFTAISSVYRLLKFAKAKRILFLVDTRNLGKQAEQEFQAFKPNDDKRLFNELYNVQRLQSNFIDSSAQVCISTIQRMYSILKGKELDPTMEDDSPYESKLINKKIEEVSYNPKVPIETFDFIIIDECHRSIYNLWKQVLDYFDAFLIGLTATPDKRTFAFFNENLVSEYTLKQSITDKVNVGYDVYTIETEISNKGSRIKAKQYVDLRNKTTREKEWRQLDDEIIYEPTQLDRDIVNPSQIRNIIKEYKRVIEEEFFTERGSEKEVPKTLIFAKTDSHAEDIVHIVREVFGEGNNFCKKITYNTKNEDPESILQQFRTAYNPRIAVTVDMIATGTDVKPIEVLLFMRDVRSRNYFQQMIGRGVRSLSKDDLRKVTNSAVVNKERFYIIDAVGVFKSVKVDYPVVDKKPSVSLKDLMKMVILQPNEENLTSLSVRLTRLSKQMDEKDKEKFKELTDGKTIEETASKLADAYDPDFLNEITVKKYNLPENKEPTEEQIKESAEPYIVEAVKPFDNHKLREFVETVRQKLYQVIDNINIDKITFSGFDKEAKENAEEIINNFRKFIDDNKDEITALRILYNEPHRRKELTYKMIKELTEVLNNHPYNLTTELIWKAYERIEPQRVKGAGIKRVLTDIVSLIRFELKIDEMLIPYGDIVNRNYRDWMFKKNAGPVQFTEEQVEWLRMIKEYLATSLRIDKNDFDLSPFIDKGGLGKFWELFGTDTDDILEEINEELAA